MKTRLVKLMPALAVAIAVACGRDDTAVDDDRTLTDTAAGVVDTAGSTTARAVGAILSDENILALLDTTYDAMLEADQLAQDRTDNEQIRSFASASVTQNAAARRAIMTTIQRVNIAPVLPDDDPIEGHAAAIAYLRQHAGSDFDEAYLEHATEMRKELIEEIDDALDDEGHADAVKQTMTEIKSQLEADVKRLEGLRTGRQDGR
jgi:predicted outer membrane protein